MLNTECTALDQRKLQGKKYAKYAQKGDWHFGQVISVQTFSYGTGMNIIKDGPVGVHKNVNCLQDFFLSDKLSKKVRSIIFLKCNRIEIC